MVKEKIKESWIRVNQRIDEFCRGNEDHSFRLLFITDVHMGAENAHHIEQLQMLQELLPSSKIDFVVNGGDIGLDVGESNEEAKRVIELTQKAMDFGDIPYFFCKGNHDIKPGLLGREGLNPYLNRYFLDKISPEKGRIITSGTNEGGYGYYVDSKTNTRFLFLNTSENLRGYDVSREQLAFVINQLETCKEKSLVLFSHFCFNSCGAWVRYPNPLSPNMVRLQGIEKAFANRGKGHTGPLDFDFTRSRSHLLLHLCGDSHFNNQSRSDGYLIACRQGYGGIDPEDIPEGASFDLFDKHEQCDFDLLVITQDHTKLFRVGAGEEIRDIEIQ